jgi:hypothetical protein
MKDESVNIFMERLDHPFKSEIEAVRQLILSVDNGITEHIKWNGPSFCFKGDDRITFRLNPPKYIQLIFHRGVKARSDVSEFTFDNPGRLIKWITTDRGTVTFKNNEEIRTNSENLKETVKNWLNATIG